MSFNLFKSSRKDRGLMRGLRSVVAGIAAVAMMSGVAYAQDGGAGSGTGSGGGGDTAAVTWTYKDGEDGSYGDPTNANVKAAMAAVRPGIQIVAWGPDNPDTSINAALSQAVSECQARGNKECRLVGVGFVWSSGTNSFTGAAGGYTAEQWQQSYTGAGIPSKTWSHGGSSYTTSKPFNDGVTTVDSLANREMTKDPTNTSVIVIVLGENEPPSKYNLTISTDQQSGADLKVGSTDPVHDVIHASNNGSSITENLTATSTLTFDGNDYLPAKSVTKTVTISNNGDTRTPDVTPSDFGWDYWQEGTYWFDTNVAQQGKMSGAVNTSDRDPRETFRVSAIPPEDIKKEVSQGVSASQMGNVTKLTTTTGAGGYSMKFVDTINPNGVDYTVSDMKVTDLTTEKDVSDQFEMSWDKSANTVTADRQADNGAMPIEHKWEFSFKVTVSLPSDFQSITDEGTLNWNHVPVIVSDQQSFDTWRPQPDKSWIKQDSDGNWQAVVDPDHTNKTGADTMKFLDGDKVASVVNGVVDAGLVEEPTVFTLTDDWTDADYIWDATTDASKIRVYEADSTSGTESTVSDIVNKGTDVTDQFDIKLDGTTATATAKESYLKTLKGLKNPKQVTLLIPGTINFANGGGAEQVREDFGKEAGDELTFCAAPGTSESPTDPTLTNSGAQTVNDHTVPTNEPYICGYIPQVEKDVVSEASQGGDQDSVDGKVVYPGQKVEYQLTTQPNIPSDLGTQITKVVFTDSYDKYLTPDKQTVEMMDLSTGKVVAKSKYETSWDDENHLFRLTVTDQDLLAQWRASGSPRIQVRFEGTVDKDAPEDHKVSNKWVLTLNNSLTPSNEVFNLPPDFTPSKEDNQSETQGDPTISIDGQTLLMGDTGNYVLNLDLTQKDQAYKVWRAGLVDDYDDEYLKILASDVEVLDETGNDVTDKFNVKIQDGVLYVFAKTVDTEIPATGETVKGDPQPEDLKEYSELTVDDYDPLNDPSIDQSLLGQTYRVVMPYKVIKVDDGYVVKNTATQIVNDQSKKTNTVSNPLKPINPAKDVVVDVNGESKDGQSIYLNSTFLYQLDSSILPADRAYPTVSEWGIDDQLDPTYDVLTGQWAVYANRDLYRDGQVIAKQGQMLAGSGFDSSELGGDMFTAQLDPTTGKVTIESTDLYRQLVSADNEHEQGWRAYIQCKRAMVTDRHENVFTERYNGKELTSNVVWTKTPDMTPSLSIEKWDEMSGWPDGDRDSSDDALAGAKDGDVIVFTITNTSKTDDEGNGAWFKASDLTLEDETIVGDGKVTDLVYPDDWDSLILKPGDSVNVKGTLTGFTTETHTDRAKVTGTPLVQCPVTDDDPFGTNPDADSDDTDKEGVTTVEVDGATLCEDTPVTSNTDDWNGNRNILAITGSTAVGLIAAMVILLAAGPTLLALRRHSHAGNHAASSK